MSGQEALPRQPAGQQHTREPVLCCAVLVCVASGQTALPNTSALQMAQQLSGDLRPVLLAQNYYSNSHPGTSVTEPGAGWLVLNGTVPYSTSPIPEQDGPGTNTGLIHPVWHQEPRAPNCSASPPWDGGALRPAAHQSKAGTSLPRLLHGALSESRAGHLRCKWKHLMHPTVL